MPLLARRTLIQGLACVASGALVSPWALARPARAPRIEGPKVGVDPLLVASGLTAQWQAAMMRDMGWSARWEPLETGSLLAQLEQGQLDAGLFLSHPVADRLDKDGLIHSRATLARTEVYLVGPVDDPAGIRTESDAARALSQVLAAHGAGAARWQAPPPDSALAALANQLSKGLALRVQGPAGQTGLSPATTARAAASAPYRLVTRAEWQRRPAPASERVKVWLAGDGALSLACDVALPFRTRHPAGKLFVSWLQGPLGQGVLKAARPAWVPAKG